ncbi:PAL-domain-containing protein [Dichomitus squalens]|nr:PAL-domain-containing protein [Dichomitus squalens]
MFHTFICRLTSLFEPTSIHVAFRLPIRRASNVLLTSSPSPDSPIPHYLFIEQPENVPTCLALASNLDPQVEDILSAFAVDTIECNSTTDSPLIDGETGEVHHGGNFQAMSVTNAMEKTRLALHHIGKLLFAQCTELINPAMNRGLLPNLAATDPSHNYFAKGIDIHAAAYVGELGYLANPVPTHVQSAEMHNPAVSSLALISARATLNSLEVLSLLVSSYLYALCQVLDLIALQHEFQLEVDNILRKQLQVSFGQHLSDVDFDSIFGLAERLTASLVRLWKEYLSGVKGWAPAAAYLGKSRGVYEFIRTTLGIRMHGAENAHDFKEGPGVEDQTIGQDISLIHEAIRDGKMQDVVVGLFA